MKHRRHIKYFKTYTEIFIRVHFFIVQSTLGYRLPGYPPPDSTANILQVEKLPQTKKTRKRSSKIKTMLITLFESKGIIHKECVPSGQTVTAEYYLDVLICLMARIRRIRHEYRDPKSWSLFHDKAPSHNAIIVRQCLGRNQVCVLNH